MSPLVSIIIPTYNRAHLIGETLDSILLQTHTNWECIIVDDGSTDNTDEILKKYCNLDSRFHYHHRPKDRLKGPNSCRNYGFEMSKGDYVNWFDSDDLYKSDALETFLNKFAEKIDVVVAKVVKVDSETKLEIKENNILSKNIIEDYFTGVITFYVCGPMWRRSFLNKQKELFDERIMNLDDWDFNLRMLYQDLRIAFINKPLIKYRIHENSLSKEIEKLNFDELKSEFSAREKHLSLIKSNKKSEMYALNIYVKNRYKYILREALVQDHPEKNHFFKKLLVKQFKVMDLSGVSKTILGFTLYFFTKKGYKFFK